MKFSDRQKAQAAELTDAEKKRRDQISERINEFETRKSPLAGMFEAGREELDKKFEAPRATLDQFNKDARKFTGDVNEGTGSGERTSGGADKAKAAADAAEAELAALREQAKAARDAATAAKEEKKQEEGPETPDAAGADKGAKTAGTFSAAAAGLLGGGSPMERTAKATEKTAAAAEKIAGNTDPSKAPNLQLPGKGFAGPQTPADKLAAAKAQLGKNLAAKEEKPKTPRDLERERIAAHNKQVEEQRKAYTQRQRDKRLGTSPEARAALDAVATIPESPADPLAKKVADNEEQRKRLGLPDLNVPARQGSNSEETRKRLGLPDLNATAAPANSNTDETRKRLGLPDLNATDPEAADPLAAIREQREAQRRADAERFQKAGQDARAARTAVSESPNEKHGTSPGGEFDSPTLAKLLEKLLKEQEKTRKAIEEGGVYA